MRDAIVVGGGPAGAACALVLAQRDVAVTVVERARFPRRKVCGEYLNAGALDALDELGLGALVRERAASISGVRLVAEGVDPIDLDFGVPACALERAELDALLLAAAQAAGAEVMTARAEDLIFDGGRVAGVAVRGAAGEIEELRSRFVVGADGSGSLVARRMGVVRERAARPRFALGGHYRGFELGERVEMYVGGRAYFALNPLGRDLTNVMVVVPEDELAAWSASVDDGMRGRAAELGRGLRSFAKAERVGARVCVGPLDFDVSSVAAPGVLLAGDASGFLSPFTGQGVALALRSGIDAGATIASVLAEPGGERDAFARYSATTVRRLSARRKSARLIEGMIDAPFLARRAARRLRKLPDLGRAVLDSLAGQSDRGVTLFALGRLVL